MNPIFLQVQIQNYAGNTMSPVDAVVFDTLLAKSGNIEFNQATGAIQLTVPGTYLIYWSFTFLAGADELAFGIVSDSGTTLSSQFINNGSQLSDSTLFEVGSSGDTIYLKNLSTSGTFTPSLIAANLLVYAMDTTQGNGPAGPAGETGPIGASGPAGETGEIGPTGPKGPMGEIGSTGPAGFPGLKGPTGPTGPMGPSGLQMIGATGPAGSAGPKGSMGPKGASGPMGPSGSAGSEGSMGAAGAKGITGPIGITGAKGPIGPTGVTGVTGFEGPQGYQGAAGSDLLVYGGIRMVTDNIATTFDVLANHYKVLPLDEHMPGVGLEYDDVTHSIIIPIDGCYEVIWFFYAAADDYDIDIRLMLSDSYDYFQTTEGDLVYITGYVIKDFMAGESLSLSVGSNPEDISLKLPPNSTIASLYVNRLSNQNFGRIPLS